MGVSARYEARFKIRDTFFERCFRRVCSQLSECFAFNKTSFHTQGFVRGTMWILEGFSRLVMRTDVKDRFISETFSFENNCVEKACLVL